MTAEVKIRSLASADATLQGYLGTDPFRWFDRQLVPTYLQSGSPCVRMLRVSTESDYNQGGLMNLDCPHFQIDVLDYDAEHCREVAAAIVTFMGTIDLTSSGQFASPYSSPNHAPCFLVNQRAGMAFDLQPPAYVETLEYRVYNRTDLP